MADLTLKQGDTEPILSATLERDGQGFDLTTVGNPSVRIVIGTTKATPIVDAPADIVNASAGEVEYDWQAGDTDTTGVYSSEFIVTGDNDFETTFPSEGFFTVEIQRDVD